MKSASKKRPSFPTDKALNNPLIANGKAGPRLLRSTEHNTSNGYPVPIRATPGNNIQPFNSKTPRRLLERISIHKISVFYQILQTGMESVCIIIKSGRGEEENK